MKRLLAGALLCLVLPVMSGAAFSEAFAASKRKQSKQPSSATSIGATGDTGSVVNSTAQGGVLAFPEGTIDPVLGSLLIRAMQKPDLLDPSYLRYYLGPPDNQVTQLNQTQSVYYWYDNLRNPRVELHTQRDVSVAAQSNVLIMHLPGQGLDFEGVQKTLGTGGKQFFDANGHPAVMYSCAPYTSVSFVSPQNTFAVQKTMTMYKGPLLPPPSEADIQIAQDEFVARVSQLSAKGKWNDVIALLQQRVREQPYSASARAALADGLSRAGHVHDAVTEYKNALGLNIGDAALEKHCNERLLSLHAKVPLPGSKPQGAGGQRPGANEKVAGTDLDNPF